MSEEKPTEQAAPLNTTGGPDENANPPAAQPDDNASQTTPAAGSTPSPAASQPRPEPAPQAPVPPKPPTPAAPQPPAAPEPPAGAKPEPPAAPAQPERTYYYPNKWARIILTSAEEVMGRQGVNAMLNMAHIPEYIGNYPPDNMKKAFPFIGVGQLQQAIWDMYGPRGARVFAVRAGEQAFLEGLAQFRSVAAAAQVAMRVGSLEGKVKLGLEFFSKFFNTVSDQVVEVDEDEKHWIWRITRCPVCWGRHDHEPVCHLAIGVLQAALAWTTNGKKFRLLETECMAMGGENCVIKIEKVPVE